MPANEFYSLVGSFLCIFCKWFGYRHLLDEIVERLPKRRGWEIQHPNYIVEGQMWENHPLSTRWWEERHVVTELAGTTRDALHNAIINSVTILFLILQVSKKKQMAEDVEFYSVMRSVRAREFRYLCSISMPQRS
jgi:GTP-binding protein